jgi:GxxExxY protein
MTENKIATLILDACFNIHRKLRPGLFEPVYEEVLSFELEKMAFSVL